MEPWRPGGVTRPQPRFDANCGSFGFAVGAAGFLVLGSKSLGVQGSSLLSEKDWGATSTIEPGKVQRGNALRRKAKRGLS